MDPGARGESAGVGSSRLTTEVNDEPKQAVIEAEFEIAISFVQRSFHCPPSLMDLVEPATA